ncbi:hypothetical protein FRC11_008339 [Ceratobasidium sp. 423]|nr:hypothetical protein FRC11_008339 [Ceratobasidium sp. 423]
MMKYQHEQYFQTLALSRPGTHAAARAQNLGYLRVLNLGQTLYQGFDNGSGVNFSEDRVGGNPSEATNVLPPLIHVRLAPTPAEFELNQYIAKGVIPIESMGAIDLVEFWRVHEFIYPLLHHIAMDVLPVRAPSVSSERIFSSSKMMCTAERSRLSVKTMEALQVLKHALKHHHRESSEPEMTLDFISHVFETL